MDIQTLRPPTYTTSRLVKKEDLNHHNTMFAGRTAEWFIEAGFAAVAHFWNAQSIVCAKVHELEFLRPINLGEVISFTSTIVHSGNSSLTVFTRVASVQKPEIILLQGFTSFVSVDEKQMPQQHQVYITPETDDELALFEKVCTFRLPNNRKLKSNCTKILIENL